MAEKARSWQLIQDSRFIEVLQRLTPKEQMQVDRRIVELTHNPLPGGNKTELVAHPGLYRVRAGEFRIIYGFNSNVVQLMTLRRRNESTYDDLDTSELEQLREFESIKGSRKKQPNLADWEKLALERSKPKPQPQTLLPHPVTDSILDELGVPEGYRAALRGITTVEGLEDCDAVPSNIRCEVIDRIFAPAKAPVAEEVSAVVSKSDIVEPLVEQLAGPLDPSTPDDYGRAEDSMTTAHARSGGEKRSLPAVIKPRPLLIRTSSKEKPPRLYSGNTSKGIAKDTRYTAKLDGKIQLRFTVGEREQALLTTDEHPELVDIVKEAKRFGSGSEAGGFIINEFRHVLVPTEKGILYAGRYYRDLEFIFDGKLITPVAPSSIKPGSVWPGPHVGVRYTLTAGATDVRYSMTTTRGTVKEVHLSDLHPKEDLRELLEMCRAVKRDGGAIFVNEARELFAPVKAGSGYQRHYIGHLGHHPWFPEPK